MQPRKQHLIETALTLFNQYGYHATGIDLILAESGVSKATLYKHFRSKEALILAALQLRHEQVITRLQATIDNNTKTQLKHDLTDQKTMNNASTNAATNKADSEKLLDIFDDLNDWFNSETFFGCNFINVSAEYADPNHPINLFAAKHKQAIVDVIGAQLAEQESHKADQIGLLIEGAIVMAHTRGMKQSALLAKEMARQLI
ncbi:TetR family transcriptional regulator [Psychromonas sp. SA13A]|uniref:TetR family transcriptional regulator n=1 Tax=Psychromonas sp. SA13A TaxID=2686346 RepID=UPI0014089D5C|nr:TetR family transcriptional regulator [Psychromonas sp. SA13A]